MDAALGADPGRQAGLLPKDLGAFATHVYPGVPAFKKAANRLAQSQMGFQCSFQGGEA